MKNKVGIGLFVFFLLCIILWVDRTQVGVDQTYLLPNGFEGCAAIFYDIKDAPPLQIVNNEIIYEVPKDGIMHTSSPTEFGWTNKKHSGAYQLKAYYVDEKGKKVRELSHEEILFGANGAMQEEGKRERKYFYLFFGSDENEFYGCPAIDDLFEQLPLGRENKKHLQFVNPL